MGILKTFDDLTPSPEDQLDDESYRKINDSMISKGVGVAILTNSYYYFIETVFVIFHKGVYRLVALNRSKIIMNTVYPSLRGAKIAFLRKFREKSWDESLQPNWTELYEPEADWLKDKVKLLKLLK